MLSLILRIHFVLHRKLILSGKSICGTVVFSYSYSLLSKVVLSQQLARDYSAHSGTCKLSQGWRRRRCHCAAPK